MATGDKLYLADKTTLDLVKQTVEEIEQSVASTASVANTISSDVKNMSQSISATREYFSATDILTNKVVENRVTLLNGATNTQLLNVQSSGVLYAAVCIIGKNTSYSNKVSLTVEIDGSKIVAIESPTESTYSYDTLCGYLSADSFLRTSNYFMLPGGNTQDNPSSNSNVYISPGALTGGVVTSTNRILYLPKPIRFESSLIIRGSSSLSNTLLSYMYELD